MHNLQFPKYRPTKTRASSDFPLTKVAFGSSMPGLSFRHDSADSYRYGFNKQERENELGDYYSFEYRIHDARIGRFLSIDPLTKNYPFYSPYSFAGNQVIWAVDLEGLEEYIVTHRSFAPWEKFGNFLLDLAPESFYGDNRGFSLCPGTKYNTLNLTGEVSARIHQSAYITFTSGERTTIHSKETFSSTTKGNVEFISGTESKAVANPTGYFDAKTNGLSMRFEGSDPLVFPAPDIDWSLDLQFNKSHLGDQQYLEVSASVKGKGFPAYESFISDKIGNKVFLFAMPSPKKTDIENELMWPFDDASSKIKIAISTDENGNFTGKLRYFTQASKTTGWLWWKKTTTFTIYSDEISIDDHNKTFLDKQAAPDLKPDEGSNKDTPKCTK